MKTNKLKYSELLGLKLRGDALIQEAKDLKSSHGSLSVVMRIELSKAEMGFIDVDKDKLSFDINQKLERLREVQREYQEVSKRILNGF